MRLLPIGALGGISASGLARAETPPIVSVADYGAVPGAADATDAVRAAIAHLPKRGGATLRFPAGVYNLSGDATDHAVALRLGGIEQLTIDGHGATLLFRGRVTPAMIGNCAGLTVRGLTVDWPRPPFSQGEVVSVTPSGDAADVRIDEGFPVDGSERIEAITTHERGTLRLAERGLDAYDVVDKVTLIGRQQLRLLFKRPLPLRLGDVVVLRHQVYGSNVFWVTGCSDVRFEDVTVFAAPGMALLAVGCTNVTIDRFRIEPRPGTARLMSTCADGLHLASCRGNIDIRRCYLAGLGDDCINVHGRMLKVAERVDARSVLLERYDHLPFRDIDVTPPGGRVEFLDRQSVASRGEMTVAQSQSGARALLRFAEDLPAALASGDLACDVGEISRVTITDCEFPGNRARAILTHRNSLIEHCSFADQSYEAILLQFDTSAEDGPTIADVTIAHNRFRGTGRGGLPRGAIRVRSLIATPGGATEPVSQVLGRGIAVVDNVIVDSGANAIEIGETGDVRIAGNRIERRPGALAVQPAIVLQNVRGVTIDDNSCRPPATLVIRDTPQDEVRLGHNAGLST